MSIRRKLVLIFSVLLGLAALFMWVMTRKSEALSRPNPGPDAPAYAMPGPHSVGNRTLITEGESPLELTVWYPAPQANVPETASTYPYRIKTGGPIQAITIASMSGQAVSNAPYDLAAGPYPLVIFSPGFALGGTNYAWLGEHLASYGLVVIAPEHQEQFGLDLDGFWRGNITRPQDVLAVLDYVDAQARAGGFLEGVVDPDVVAVAGHSLGGYTALATAGARIDIPAFEMLCQTAREDNNPDVWLCDMLLPNITDMAALAGYDSLPEGLWPAWVDARLDAIVPMAGDAYLFGEAGLAQITVPVLAIGGTADSDTPYEWGAQPTYEYVSSPRKAILALHGAGHMIFTNTCQAVPRFAEIILEEFCADAAWDRNQAHDLISHVTTAFLLAELKHDSEAAAALTPDAVSFPNVAYDAQGY